MSFADEVNKILVGFPDDSAKARLLSVDDLGRVSEVRQRPDLQANVISVKENGQLVQIPLAKPEDTYDVLIDSEGNVLVGD